MRPLGSGGGGGGLGALPPAAAEYSHAHAALYGYDFCYAMEGLLAPRALLAPVALGDLFGGSSSIGHRRTYAGVLAVCAVFFVITVILGAVTAAVVSFCSRVASSAPQTAEADNGPSPSPSTESKDEAPRVVRVCAAVRFPATLIETFLFLASGAAVAAGMALGGGGGPHAKANGDSDGSMAAAAVTAALLVAAPIGACVVVGQWAPRRALRRAIAARRDRKMRRDAALAKKPHIHSADQIGVGGASPQRRYRHDSAMKKHNRKGNTCKKKAGRMPLLQRSLVCLTVVTPSTPTSPPLTRSGDLFGPVAGDLRSLHRLAPAAPFALPLALLAVSAAVAAANRCDTLPLAAGAVLAAYAVLVAALRPFVGAARVGAAAGLAAVAAGLLFGLYGALAAAPSPAAWGADEAMSALLTALVAVSNCRYPFVVARVLGLRLPSFILRFGSSPPERSNAADECADATTDANNNNVCRSPQNIDQTAAPIAPSPTRVFLQDVCAAEADADADADADAVVWDAQPPSKDVRQQRSRDGALDCDAAALLAVAVAELPTAALTTAYRDAPVGLCDDAPSGNE